MRKGQHFARTFKRAVAVEYSQFCYHYTDSFRCH